MQDAVSSLQIGFSYLNALCKERNLSIKIERLEKSRVYDELPVNTYYTYACYLQNHYGILSEELGKGISQDDSKASAIFECIEHFVDEPVFYNHNKDKFDIIFLDKRDIIHKNSEWKGLHFQILHELKFDLLPCFRFISLFNQDNLAYIPITITSSSYPKGFFCENIPFEIPDETNYSDLYQFLKYASSNGGAIANNTEEALIHAINELIERDAHSLFLLECFQRGNISYYRQVDKQSLPNRLQDIADYIENTYKTKLIILNITSDLGISTFIFYCTDNYFYRKAPDSGVGTSLFREYALERNLLELIQSLNIEPGNIYCKEMDIFYDLCQEMDIKFYQNAYEFDPSIFLNNRVQHFDDISSYTQLSTTQQLEKQKEILKENDIDLFYQVVSIQENIVKVKCLSPDLEDICISGHIRLPSSRRGIGYINA